MRITKKLFEEYSFTILSAVIALILIAIAMPVITAIKGNIVDSVETFNNTTTLLVDKTRFTIEKNSELKYLYTTDRVYSAYSSVLHSVPDLKFKSASGEFLKTYKDAQISAHVWNYPESFGGGYHLGTDYAVPSGSEVIAPANGLVVSSVNGCEVGYLGDTCGGYAGNNIIFITSVDNKVFAIRYAHLLKNTVVEPGYYEAGSVIAKSGSSGNSTGPHTHVEMFYLGEGNFEELESDYLHREYNASFGTGYGYTGYMNRCDARGGQEVCRLDSEQFLR